MSRQEFKGDSSESLSTTLPLSFPCHAGKMPDDLQHVQVQAAKSSIMGSQETGKNSREATVNKGQCPQDDRVLNPLFLKTTSSLPLSIPAPFMSSRWALCHGKDLHMTHGWTSEHSLHITATLSIASASFDASWPLLPGSLYCCKLLFPGVVSHLSLLMCNSSPQTMHLLFFQLPSFE